MKHLIKGYLVYETASWRGDDERINFQGCKPWSSQQAILIGLHEFEVELPDNFDPRPEQIKALKAQKQKARADFELLCTQIQRQISELSAITMAEAV